MNAKLREHVQTMLERFAHETARRNPPGLLRTIGMYQCVRLAFERAVEEPERKFWRKYLDGLNEKAERERAAILKQREGTMFKSERAEAFFEARKRGRVWRPN